MVRFHDLSADRQPDSGAADVAVKQALDPIELLEDVLERIERDANADIFYAYLHHLTLRA
jgi:hypothetical protein